MWGTARGILASCGRPPVWRAYIAPPVRIAAAYVGCRTRAVWATAARAVAIRVGIDAMRLLAECGQSPNANWRGQRYTCKRCGSDSIMCAVCVRIRRVRRTPVLVGMCATCSFSLDELRRWGVGSRLSYHELGMAERGYEARPSELGLQTTQGRVARGMAVFVSKRLPQADPPHAWYSPLRA